MVRRGLSVGKFYPPHRGHLHLLQTALDHCDELHVLLCDRAGQVPEGFRRLAWLRELLPQVHFYRVDDTLDDDDSEGWAAETLRVLGFRPDVAFTSEEYGHAYSRFLGCPHHPVDPARTAVPISGTAIRTDPLAHWSYIPVPVREYYARRVVLIGAESTGKTTLAEALAQQLSWPWVPEYGRDYSEEMLARHGEYRWQSADFEAIAREQNRRENLAARACQGVLLCDTDATATTVWHHRYMGYRSPGVEALAASQPVPALYIIGDPDTPFVPDGTRDGEALRAWMHELFVEAVRRRGAPWIMPTGSLEERVTQVLAALKQHGLLRHG